jgi:hypothetical protein
MPHGLIHAFFRIKNCFDTSLIFVSLGLEGIDSEGGVAWEIAKENLPHHGSQFVRDAVPCKPFQGY